MSDVQELIGELQSKFRERLQSEVRELDISGFYPDMEATIWYAKVPTGTEADKILRHVNEGNMFAASVEAIMQRICKDARGTKKMFPPNMRDEVARFDPKFLAWLAGEIGAFEDISVEAKVEEYEKKPSSSTDELSQSGPSQSDGVSHIAR